MENALKKSVSVLCNAKAMAMLPAPAVTAKLERSPFPSQPLTNIITKEILLRLLHQGIRDGADKVSDCGEVWTLR